MGRTGKGGRGGDFGLEIRDFSEGRRGCWRGFGCFGGFQPGEEVVESVGRGMGEREREGGPGVGFGEGALREIFGEVMFSQGGFGERGVERDDLAEAVDVAGEGAGRFEARGGEVAGHGVGQVARGAGEVAFEAGAEEFVDAGDRRAGGGIEVRDDRAVGQDVELAGDDAGHGGVGRGRVAPKKREDGRAGALFPGRAGFLAARRRDRAPGRRSIDRVSIDRINRMRRRGRGKIKRSSRFRKSALRIGGSGRKTVHRTLFPRKTYGPRFAAANLAGRRIRLHPAGAPSLRGDQRFTGSFIRSLFALSRGLRG